MVVLAPGVYKQGAYIDVPRLTLRGLPGAHLHGTPVGGKAALVIRAPGVTIDGIENAAQLRICETNLGVVQIDVVLQVALFATIEHRRVLRRVGGGGGGPGGTKGGKPGSPPGQDKK